MIAATAAMGQVERGANRIYGIPVDRPVLTKYGRALALALSAGVLTLIAFVAFMAGPALTGARLPRDSPARS